MAQELLQLIPKRIGRDGWPEDAIQAMDAKIRQNPTVLREDPHYPFHSILGRRAPFVVVKTCLDLDPDIVTLPNEGGRLPIDIIVGSMARAERPIFDILFESSLKAIPDLAARIDPHSGSTLLHRACLYCNNNDVEVLQRIYEANPDALTIQTTSSGQLPIHHFRRIDRNLAAIQFLLGKNPELISKPDSNGQLLLHKLYADTHSDPIKHDEAFRFLLEAYPEAAQVANDKGNLPLHLAVSCRRGGKQKNNDANFLEEIKSLLGAYPDAIRKTNMMGLCPLHKIFLNDSSGKQPDITMVKLFVSTYPEAVRIFTQGTNIKTDEKKGVYGEDENYLPLHIACRFQRGLDVIQTLVDAYPESVTIPTPNFGVLPFHIASAVPSDLSVLQYLAEQHPKAIETVDHRGQLPLHLTSIHSPKASDWLLTQCPEAIFHQDSRHMELPIHTLLRAPIKDETKALLDRMVAAYPKSLETPNDRGSLPLHYAVYVEASKRDELVLPLLEANPQAASHASKEGNLPLHSLCTSFNPSFTVTEALIEAYPQAIQTANSKGYLPLHTACAAAQKLSFVQKLVKQFPAALTMATNDGRFALHLACEHRCDLDVIQWLTNQNPNAMTTPCSGCSRLPLHYACAYRPAANSTMVGGGKVYPESSFENDKKMVQLRHTGCAFEGKFGRPYPGQGTVEWIVSEFPQTARHVDQDGWTPLHAACGNSLYMAGFEALYQAYPEAVDMRDHEGWVPLHCAVAFWHPREIVQEVVRRDPPSKEELEAPVKFHWCLHGRQGRGPIIEHLLKVNPDSIRVADKEGWLPLHSAVASGNKCAALKDCYKENFLEAYSMPTSDGSLPLHIFAARRSTDLDSVDGKKLIELNKAALVAKDNHGRTPLDIARDRGKE